MSVRTRRKAKAKRAEAFAAMVAADPHGFLRKLADHAGEYAGVPYPIAGEQLIIHPSYRFANVFKKKAPELTRNDPTEPQWESIDETMQFRTRNEWFSISKGFVISIYQDPRTGRVIHYKTPPRNRAAMQLNTMGCASAWQLKCELRAQEKLKTLLKPHLFDMYLLTGAFLETSKRSKVTYMFRRLRPTLAMSGATGDMRILCGLCLHPIGFYSGTWAGCMVPTDEVIAHLLLMRGDEPDFWRQANQHPAWRSEAGL